MDFSFRFLIAVLTSLTMAMPACGPKRSTNNQQKVQAKEKAPTKEQIQQTNIQLNNDRKVLQQTIREKNAEIARLNDRIRHGELNRQVQVEAQQQLDRYRQTIIALRRKVEEMEELRQRIEIVSAQLAQSEMERMKWMKKAQRLRKILNDKMREEREKEEDKELEVDAEDGSKPDSQGPSSGEKTKPEIKLEIMSAEKSATGKNSDDAGAASAENSKQNEEGEKSQKLEFNSAATDNGQMKADTKSQGETPPANDVEDEDKQVMCQTKEQLEKEIAELREKEKAASSEDDKKSIKGQIETKDDELKQMNMDCSSVSTQNSVEAEKSDSEKDKSQDKDKDKDKNKRETENTAVSKDAAEPTRAPSKVDEVKVAKENLAAAQKEKEEAEARLKEASSADKMAAEAAVNSAQKKVDDAQAELRRLLEMGDEEISMADLLKKAEDFLTESGEGLSKARKELQMLIRQLQTRKTDLMSEISKVETSIESSSGLSDADKEALMAEYEKLKGEADSVPSTIMSRLQNGDLAEQEHPFYVVVYGSIPETETGRVLQAVLQTNHVKVIAGMEDSSQEELAMMVAEDKAGIKKDNKTEIETPLPAGQSSLKAFYHRHLVQGQYKQLMMLISELNKLSESGAILVSIKPLERIEVDSWLSWTTKKDPETQRQVLLGSKGGDGQLMFNAQEMSVDKLMSAAENLEVAAECAYLNKMCVEKLLEKGILKKPAGEAETIAEKAFKMLSEAVKAQGEEVVLNLVLETRVWAVQAKTATEDPVQRELLIDGLTRQQIRDGMAIPNENTGYILEDTQARYYLLPESKGAGWPESFIGSDKDADRMKLLEEISSVLQ